MRAILEPSWSILPGPPGSPQGLPKDLQETLQAAQGPPRDPPETPQAPPGDAPGTSPGPPQGLKSLQVFVFIYDKISIKNRSKTIQKLIGS